MAVKETEIFPEVIRSQETSTQTCTQRIRTHSVLVVLFCPLYRALHRTDVNTAKTQQNTCEKKRTLRSVSCSKHAAWPLVKRDLKDGPQTATIEYDAGGQRASQAKERQEEKRTGHGKDWTTSYRHFACLNHSAAWDND